MELATPPKSPRTEQVSQQSWESQQSLSLENIRKLRESTEQKLDQYINRHQSSNIAPNERLKYTSKLTDQIFENAKRQKIELDKQRHEEVLSLRKENEKLLSQNSGSSDPGATFLRYCVMAGFLALFIRAVASSAKIMTLCNHFINQIIKT